MQLGLKVNAIELNCCKLSYGLFVLFKWLVALHCIIWFLCVFFCIGKGALVKVMFFCGSSVRFWPGRILFKSCLFWMSVIGLLKTLSLGLRSHSVYKRKIMNYFTRWLFLKFDTQQLFLVNKKWLFKAEELKLMPACPISHAEFTLKKVSVKHAAYTLPSSSKRTGLTCGRWD